MPQHAVPSDFKCPNTLAHKILKEESLGSLKLKDLLHKDPQKPSAFWWICYAEAIHNITVPSLWEGYKNDLTFGFFLEEAEGKSLFWYSILASKNKISDCTFAIISHQFPQESFQTLIQIHPDLKIAPLWLLISNAITYPQSAAFQCLMKILQNTEGEIPIEVLESKLQGDRESIKELLCRKGLSSEQLSAQSIISSLIAARNGLYLAIENSRIASLLSAPKVLNEAREALKKAKQHARQTNFISATQETDWVQKELSKAIEELTLHEEKLDPRSTASASASSAAAAAASPYPPNSAIPKIAEAQTKSTGMLKHYQVFQDQTPTHKQIQQQKEEALYFISLLPLNPSDRLFKWENYLIRLKALYERSAKFQIIENVLNELNAAIISHAIESSKRVNFFTFMCQDCHLTRIPSKLIQDNLNYWKGITGVYLSKNRLKTLPKEIEHLTILKCLYVENNLLESLPSELDHLELTTLCLNSNNLARLPSRFSNLTSLRSLSLHNNQFKNFPVEVLNLRELQELSLSGNNLVCVPANFNGNNLKCNGNKQSIEELLATQKVSDTVPSLRFAFSGFS